MGKYLALALLLAGLVLLSTARRGDPTVHGGRIVLQGLAGIALIAAGAGWLLVLVVIAL